MKRDNRNSFQLEDYQKPITTDYFYSNNYVEYKISVDRNKTLSIEEYLKEIRPYLKDLNNLCKI